MNKRDRGEEKKSGGKLRTWKGKVRKEREGARKSLKGREQGIMKGWNKGRTREGG